VKVNNRDQSHSSREANRNETNDSPYLPESSEQLERKSDDYEQLLKVNHQNLHDSFWEAHKIAWTVTNIFIPVLFAGTGFVFRDALQREDYTIFEAILAGLLGELLLAIWWLLMQMIEHYNDVRRKRLKAIEIYFSKQYSGNSIPPLQQYHGMGYRPELNELRKLKFPFSWICNISLTAYISIVSLFVISIFLADTGKTSLSALGDVGNLDLLLWHFEITSYEFRLNSVRLFLLISWLPLLLVGLLPWLFNRLKALFQSLTRQLQQLGQPHPHLPYIVQISYDYSSHESDIHHKLIAKCEALKGSPQHRQVEVIEEYAFRRQREVMAFQQWCHDQSLGVIVRCTGNPLQRLRRKLRRIIRLIRH
jgi:hypothetical protein